MEKLIGKNFKVIYFAETDRNREWQIVKNGLKFLFAIMFEGKRNEISPIKLAIKTYKMLNHYEPQVVIIGGYNFLACWVVLMWTKARKRKLIVIIESHYLDKPRTIIKENIKKFFVSKCDAALVDGTRHRDYTVSLGLKPEKIFIKKSTGPVDVSWYQKEVLRFRNNKPKLCDKLHIPYKNFLFVGRFSPEKNIISLLKVYKKLKTEIGQSWGLILVGNGPQRTEIENFIRKKGLRDILLPGFKQKEEVALFYAISDVFIVPSVSEPWGLVVNEAMASSLPVLVSNRCGCYPDIVHDSVNGFSFDPFKENELFELMSNVMYGKYDLEAMGRASLEIIRDYTPEKIAEIYLNAINFVQCGMNK